MATANPDLVRMGAWDACIPLLKPVLSRAPLTHLGSGCAQLLVLKKGYRH